MLKYNGHILKVGSGTIKYTFTPPTYTVTCTATHGSVTATPSQGISGTLITLSNTPDSGYEFDYYTVNGITLVGNTFTLTEDVTVECVFKEIPVVTYDYFTFKACSNWTCMGDPAYWCAKVYSNSGLYDLTSGTRSNLNTSGDAMNWTVTADHMYRLEWVPQDVETTRNYNPARFLQYPVFYGTVTMDGIGEIYSLDFWDKAEWYNVRFSNATVIPQNAANIHRGGNLTNCRMLFLNANLTCPIIPFIEAMLEACPNLTDTYRCFFNCSSPDYAEACERYPEWTID